MTEYGVCDVYGKRPWYMKVLGLIQSKDGYKVYSTLLYPGDWEDSK